jgi:hypothetical protein
MSYTFWAVLPQLVRRGWILTVSAVVILAAVAVAYQIVALHIAGARGWTGSPFTRRVRRADGPVR